MQAKTDDSRGLWTVLVGDGCALITLTGLALIVSGVFASFQAATGHFLPHDEAYLGATAAELCQLQDCRVVHFMIHDRISFGGMLIAIGTLYLYLAAVPLAEGRPWAWWTLLASGMVGFASFGSYFGYGYLDTWHGMATLVLLPIYVVGMFKTRTLLQRPMTANELRDPAVHKGWRSRAGLGRGLLLFVSLGLMLAGLVIMIVGMTSVFVPQDLAYMGLAPAELNELNPRLIPLIAHDRAGFGGGTMCFGLTMMLCVWFAPLSRALWQALLVAGVVSFGAAIGVHFPIGYTDLSHLAPAYAGALLFAAAMVLTRPTGRRAA